MHKVVIAQSLHPQGVQRLVDGLGPDFAVVDRGNASLPELLEALESSEFAIGQKFTEEMGRHAPGLRLLHAQGSGTDDIDRRALPPGCYLANVYEHEVAIAEHVFMLMISLARDLLALDAGLRRGDMGPAGHYGGPERMELHGTTLGIVGYGRIGREIARRAHVFGMRVVAVKGHPDPELAERDGLAFLGSPADVSRIAAESDFLVVCAPLTSETDGLVGAEAIGRMKPTAYLINVGRGRVVAEEPLYRALRDRKIAGAAIDVWYTYPPVGELGQPGHFPFQALSNVIMTPHVAGWTNGTVSRRMAFIVENIKRVTRGEEPLNVVAQG
jgi:phosphoglycerate dehydrogenase-like enzyme